MNGTQTVFDRIREKNPMISGIVSFQNSAVYPFLFAVLCAISGANGKEFYLPIIYLLTALSVFGGLFSRDLKVFLVPALLIYYSVGMDVPSEHYTTWEFDYRPMFDISSLPHLMLCLALLVAALVYRLISSGAARDMVRKRGILLSGILLVDAALLLNGAFTADWHIANLGYALLTAVPLTLFYCLFLAVIGNSENGISYACQTLMALGVSVAIQVATIAYRFHLQNHLFWRYANGKIYIINRAVFSNSWGLATIISAVTMLAIPASLYLARSHKFPIFQYLSTAMFFAVALTLGTRSAMIVGIIVFVMCTVANSTDGRSKLFSRFITFFVFSGGFALIYYLLTSDSDTAVAFSKKLLQVIRFNNVSVSEEFFSN
ncbi:MAG: hypothetical protein IIV03_04895, partial [Clostridia bacterium]|nr:hypothetical protein [Clostridia bacterium]